MFSPTNSKSETNPRRNLWLTRNSIRWRWDVYFSDLRLPFLWPCQRRTASLLTHQQMLPPRISSTVPIGRCCCCATALPTQAVRASVPRYTNDLPSHTTAVFPFITPLDAAVTGAIAAALGVNTTNVEDFRVITRCFLSQFVVGDDGLDITITLTDISWENPVVHLQNLTTITRMI